MLFYCVRNVRTVKHGCKARKGMGLIRSFMLILRFSFRYYRNITPLNTITNRRIFLNIINPSKRSKPGRKSKINIPKGRTLLNLKLRYRYK